MQNGSTLNSPLKGKTVVFLGSSVTYGSAAHGVSFVEDLAEATGLIAVKEAVSGTTLVNNGEQSYFPRLRALALESANLFVCQLSTNDATRKMPLGAVTPAGERENFDDSTIAGAIESIIAYAQSKWHCPVVFYTNPKYESADYAALVELLGKIQKKWNIGVIDLWNDEAFNSITPAQRERYMADPIHPTREGYAEWWTPRMRDELQMTISKRIESLNKRYASEYGSQ